MLLRTSNQHARYLAQCRIESMLVLVEVILMLSGDDDASDDTAVIFIIVVVVDLFLNEEHIVRYPLLVQISHKGCHRLRQALICLSLKRKARHSPMQFLHPANILPISFGNDSLGGCIGNGKIVSTVGEQSLPTRLVIQLGGVQNVKMQMIDRREGAEAVETDAECVGRWVRCVAAIVNLACDMVNISPEQSYSQVDGLGCQLLR